MRNVSVCFYRQTTPVKRRNSRLFLPIVVSLMVSGLFLQPRSSRADDYVPGTVIYLVTEVGLIDVTATYSSVNSTVLDENGIPVTVILNYQGGHVTDINGNIIGILD